MNSIDWAGADVDTHTHKAMLVTMRCQEAVATVASPTTFILLNITVGQVCYPGKYVADSSDSDMEKPANSGTVAGFRARKRFTSA
ncbi:MAG: hypothetical protein AB3X41_07005 [Leptothrix ochracea]|uniref:hypothetical protein n=1 Tax=Leptothrix ochracea TaxID=735331 RepID=UPI0034E2B111